MTLAEYLADRRARIDAELDRIVPAEDVRPATIHRAMRHSLFAGGKRIRPILFCAAAEAVAGERHGDAGLQPGAIHTYRSSTTTCPRSTTMTFGAASPPAPRCSGGDGGPGGRPADRAFQALAEAAEISERRRIELVRLLAGAAGTVDGMIGGQVEDLEAEGKPVEPDRLHYIHRSKTGALLRASVEMGGVYACADDAASQGLREYGRRIGLAFQIVDDILDVTADSATLGKTAGKDAAQGKATFPALYGLEESRRQAREHYEAGLAAIEPLGEPALRLRQIAERVVTRSA